jgi:hypothetical protein
VPCHTRYLFIPRCEYDLDPAHGDVKSSQVCGTSPVVQKDADVVPYIRVDASSRT